MRWRIGIAVVLALFVAVQITFAVVAVLHADPVDPSYEAEAR